ncbi:putative pectinesterase/pectinesterase inhibitor 51 protein [Corchorus olitorius]|uniref:Pectinesterase/pectinesterase inhibitor 51 protein n=1 Tax=Corchorus olitorius TaxID=93759 RepID=A0A1R3IFB6_9ROSI|nr:putative pectinesterase/pectinesterase inhibitor 51 protein [Corchorus olitorius]
MEYLTLVSRKFELIMMEMLQQPLLPPFRIKPYIFAGSRFGKLMLKGSCNSGLMGNKLHCACCAINWSTSTRATMASTIGTAASAQDNPKLLVRSCLEKVSQTDTNF